jgi:hypothetical protein
MPSAAAAVCGAATGSRAPVRAGRGRLLTGGELGPDRGDVLIKLGHGGNPAVVSDAFQRGLADVAGEPEGSSGQRRGRFCHITTIPGNT